MSTRQRALDHQDKGTEMTTAEDDTTAVFSQPSPARITAVRAVPLMGASPEGGWSNEIRPEDSIHAVVAVHTDAGVSGYGSAFTNGRLVNAALDVLEPLLLGQNALEPERVTEILHQNTFWMGRGGTITHAISGIDIALWDILGKVTGLSLGTLLGGRYRERVRPYCSLLMDDPERMAEIVSPHLEVGFRAFKIGWGPFGRRENPALDEAIVRATRDAIGSDNQLFVDAGASDAFWPNGLRWAINTARMLRDYDVGWFEEALKPDALDDFRELRRQSPVPIAGGEVFTRRQTFVPWLTQGALDIVQPDVTKVGGLSEQRRIAWLAREFGVKYVGHGWNTALGLAADLHLASALPDCDLVEYIGGSPYVDDLVREPIQLDSEGFLPIPDRPGLGFVPDREKLQRYTADAARLFS
jgi:D-galactarolactone cycloisomerase